MKQLPHAKILQKIKECVFWSKYNSIQSVYIISSIARGDFVDKKSDIDLLVIFKNSTNTKEMTDAVESIKKKLSLSELGHDNSSYHNNYIDILYVKVEDIPTSKEESANSSFSVFRGLRRPVLRSCVLRSCVGPSYEVVLRS